MGGGGVTTVAFCVSRRRTFSTLCFSDPLEHVGFVVWGCLHRDCVRIFQGARIARTCYI